MKVVRINNKFAQNYGGQPWIWSYGDRLISEPDLVSTHVVHTEEGGRYLICAKEEKVSLSDVRAAFGDLDIDSITPLF